MVSLNISFSFSLAVWLFDFVLSSSNYNGCTYSLRDINGVSTKYNLSKFHLTSESYLVDDDEIEDWKYRFNVCGAISDTIWFDDDYIPSYCRNEEGTSDPCISINSINGTCNKKYNITQSGEAASAVQINEAHSVCHWLGSELNVLNFNNYNVSLYDTSDSASGIVYSILNGEWCSAQSVNRQLNIEFICPDSNRYYFDPSLEASIEEVVVEYPQCTYTISYESPLACPSDCISESSNNEYSVCSTNGICVADPNLNISHCLCDDGWSGDLCDIESDYDMEIISTVHSAMIASVIICIILLILSIAVSLYLCHRIRLKEEQIVSKQGNLAQSMLQNDQITSSNNVTNIDGTSMNIAMSESQPFQTRSNVDINVQNEVAQQHQQETLLTSNNENDTQDNNEVQVDANNEDTNEDTQ